MAAHAYETALQMAESLSPEERRRLLVELEARLASSAPPEKKHSIMEFRGMGKEVWEGIDAQEYVRSERASWDW